MIRDLLTSPDRRSKARRKLANLMRAHAFGLDQKYELYRYHFGGCQSEAEGSFKSLAARAPWAGQSEYFEERLSVDEKKDLLEVAADRLAGKIDLLGSGLIFVGLEPDWHRDFIGGYRWDPGVHFSKFDWAKFPEGVEIKAPWELSRCMHFGAWGVAFQLTGDEEYYRAIKDQLRHWLTQNPFERGVNWACPMDVGLRAANWINALVLFRDRILVEKEKPFLEQVLQSLWLHGRHLARNLEWNGPVGRTGGNHLIANLLGLLAIGQIFQKESWREAARSELENQIQKQTLDDGCNFELATSYHRLVLEMFTWAGQVESNFSPEYHDKVEKMRSFVAAYSKGNGLSPQFGDNDSGRLFSSGIDDERDHRYLALRGGGKGGRLHRALLWMDHLNDVEGEPNQFPDGGFCFFGEGVARVGFRAGALSATGGHAHCDQLSLVLTVFGERVLVDRGVYCYTSDPETRNAFRATSAHNTAKVGQQEQNYFGRTKREVFGIRDDTQAKVLAISGSSIEASHSGFKELVFRRCLNLNEGELLIEDSFDGETPESVTWYFHFAPECAPRMEGGGVRITMRKGEVGLSFPEEMTAELVETDHSDRYGEKVSAKTLILEAGRVAGEKRIRVNWSPKN